jgi:thioredoxin 1
MGMIEISDQRDLTNQLSQSKKVVALFYASWCPFCRSFLSVFGKYAQTTDFAVFLRVKIDEDDNPLWEIYSLEAVPSIILFENGKVSRRLDCELGAGLNEKQFSEWLQTL